MKQNKIYYIITLLLVVAIVSFGISLIQKTQMLNSTLDALELARNELDMKQNALELTQNELAVVQEALQAETEKSALLTNEVDRLTQELTSAKETIEYLDKQSGVHNGWAMCWREVNLEQWEIDFFAKLLYCEAGIMGHEGQFWVASAILNLSERRQASIWDIGHDPNTFTVAPWVDDATPTQQQYDIIYEVLNNGWIADVCFFRTNHPHSFGNFMTQIENIYFSSP